MNKEYSRQYYLNHKADMLKYARRYYVDHKENLKQYDQQYRLAHKNKIIERQRIYDLNNKLKRISYRLRNKDKIRLYQNNYSKKYGKEKAKKWRNKNRVNYLLSSFKQTDKQKGFTCNLTISWLKENIITKPCYYCGDTENIGCDRIDNNQGHTIDNVVPCCRVCNSVRNNIFTIQEMSKLGIVIKQIKLDRKIV
jgi:hypothetical protein